MASSGFINPHYKDCKLEVVAGSSAEEEEHGKKQNPRQHHVVLHAEGDTMTFNEARDEHIYFVDAFNAGKVFTEGMVREHLAESFGIGLHGRRLESARCVKPAGSFKTS